MTSASSFVHHADDAAPHASRISCVLDLLLDSSILWGCTRTKTYHGIYEYSSQTVINQKMSVKHQAVIIHASIILSILSYHCCWL